MSRLARTRRRAVSGSNDLASFGDKNDSFVAKFCAFALAVNPILQHYTGPIANAGITVLIVLSPFIYLRLLATSPTLIIKHAWTILPLVVFYLYKLFAHGTYFVECVHVAVMILYFTAIASGCINVKYYVRIASGVAALASILLLLQYFCFYILGFHLQLVPTSLFHPDSEQWVLGARTGLVGITGRTRALYRPSAFFLEPSHVFLYAIPLLCILLLAPDMKTWRLRIALLITLGLFLSTSGMGVCVGTGVWLVYGGFYRGKTRGARIRNLLTPANMILIAAILLSLVILYFKVPFFNQSINRILGLGIDIVGTDAISGRVKGAHSLAQTLTGSKFWFGMEESISDIEFNLSGYYGTLLRYGAIGTLISYVFYVRSLFKLKAQYFWLSFIIIVISFFTAHTHGTFYLLYFVVFLMDGYNTATPRRHFAAIKRPPHALPQREAIARS